MKKHELKVLPEFFSAVVDGKKKAEFRLNDRNFKIGDMLCLYEFGVAADEDGLEGFSGAFVWVRVTHVTDLSPWKPGYVMLSIELGPFTC